MKEDHVCSTMPELLTRMMSDSFGSRKYAAMLHRFRPAVLFVEEYFDDGKGHSGAFTNKRTPVTEEVFLKAVEERYVGGVLKPGYVSETEFVITDRGKAELWERGRVAKEAVMHLCLTKGMTACDVYPFISHTSLERVQKALDELARLGYAEPSEHDGQKTYHRTQRARF